MQMAACASGAGHANSTGLMILRTFWGRGTICNGGNLRIGVFGRPITHILRGKSPDTTAESASRKGQSLYNSMLLAKTANGRS